MICKMCATGADVQSRAKEIKAEPRIKMPDTILKLMQTGKLLHGYCNGCDCAHKEVV